MHTARIHFIAVDHSGRTSVFAVTTDRALEKAKTYLTEHLTGIVREVNADEAARLLERTTERFGAGCYLDSGRGHAVDHMKIVHANQLYLNLMRAINCNASLSPVALTVDRSNQAREKLSIRV